MIQSNDKVSGPLPASPAGRRAVFHAEELTKVYQMGEVQVHALRGVNLDLYDGENTRYLARKSWMMTCTDGRDPGPGQAVTHPRVFGAFTKKLRDFVLDEDLLDMTFVVRSMTGAAADFLGWAERGYLREGYVADIAVLDPDAIHDLATYEEPQQYAEGTVHVLVNGAFAVRDGEATGALAGRPLVRGGEVF